MELLQWRISKLKAGEAAEAQIFRSMAMYAPAFGMLGTLLGLISMLHSLQGDFQSIGAKVLARLAPTFMAPGQMISVEGHTDNVPISTDAFPSNWELSVSRASRVVRYLAECGVPANRLRAIGYGETRPLADNSDDQGRTANRRVSIVIDLAIVGKTGSQQG